MIKVVTTIEIIMANGDVLTERLEIEKGNHLLRRLFPGLLFYHLTEPTNTIARALIEKVKAYRKGK